MKDVVGYIDSPCENCSGDHLELSDKNMPLSLFQAVEFLDCS